MKRSDNAIYKNNNENNRRFKYIEQINTNIINNLQENINKNIINSCTDKNITNYNSKNTINIKQNIKPNSFIPQEIKIETTENYIINNNNRNTNQFKTRNIQTSTIGNSIDQMNRRRTITTNNEVKGDADQNFNYVFKQNNFYNNRYGREDLFDYKYVQK